MGKLSQHSVVDFVNDCGADPTGVIDVAPAFDKAFAIMSQMALAGRMPKLLTLYLPPGLYQLLSTPGTALWNFLSLGTSLLIVGEGDASVLSLNGFNPPVIANAYQTTLRDFAIYGNLNAPISNDLSTWEILSTYDTLLDNLTVNNILASSAMFTLLGDMVTVRDCRFEDVATAPGGFGAVYTSSVRLVRVEDSIFIDLGALNQLLQVDKVAASEQNVWIYVAGPTPTVKISSCLFDESVQSQVKLVGSAGNEIGYVRIENCLALSPTGGPGPGVSINSAYVDWLDVQGFFYQEDRPATVLQATHTRIATLEKMVLPAATFAANVIVDSTCEKLVITETEANLSVQSSATSTVSTEMNSSGVVYVMATGNDTTGNGSEEFPLLTIDAAVASIVAASTQLGSPVNSTIQIGPGNFAAPTALPGYIALNGLDPNNSPGLTGAIGLAAGFIADGQVFLGDLTVFDAQTINFGAFTGAVGLVLFNMSAASDWTVEGGVAGWTYYAQSAAFEGAATFQDAAQFTSLKSSYLGATTLHAANFNMNVSLVGDTHLDTLTLTADAGKTMNVDADHLVQSAFTITGAGVVNYVGNATQQVGTPGSSLGVIRRYQVVATTNLAVAVTVDTGYQPLTLHSANLAGDTNVVDRTNNHSASQSGLGVIYNDAGTLTVRGQSWAASVGDAGLSTCTIAFGVSAGNTLTVTFTPPAAFGGALDWQLETLVVTEN